MPDKKLPQDLVVGRTYSRNSMAGLPNAMRYTNFCMCRKVSAACARSEEL